ncbi:MAG: hypothetical protein QM747_03735 [Nocardioides sp.]
MTTRNRYYPAIQGEAEAEDEAFLGGLASIAGSLLGEGEGEYEFEFEAEAEAESAREGEDEDEFEAEEEDEAEGFVNPVRRVYRDAELMAHLANQAAQTESEAEAEAFIGALVPIAAKLIPRAAQLIRGNAPALLRGTTRIVRRLRRDPATRRLVNAVPVVLQRTAQSLADQAAAGRPIDASTVVRTLGTMTGRVLRGPNARRAVSAVDVFNRRYHRRRRWQQRTWRGRHPRYRRRYGYGYDSGYGYQPRYRRPTGYRITSARRRPVYARRHRGVRAR